MGSPTCTLGMLIALSMCHLTMALLAHADEPWLAKSTAYDSSSFGSLGDEVSLLQSTWQLTQSASKATMGFPYNQGAGRQQYAPLFWVHVPKTGTTVINTLLHLPGICPALPADVFADTEDELGALLGEYHYFEVCAGLEYHFGHAAIGSLYATSVKGHGVIFLRQPEQRLISAYYDRQHSWPLGLPLATSVRQFAEVEAGCVVRMLTQDGAGTVDLAAGGFRGGPCGGPYGPSNPSSADIALAKRRLIEGFVFVGLTEEWDLAICLMHAMFGGACHAAEFSNMHPGANSSGTGELYDTAELGGFRDVVDGVLYEDAQAIFAAETKQYGVSSSSCAPCFAQAQAETGA